MVRVDLTISILSACALLAAGACATSARRITAGAKDRADRSRLCRRILGGTRLAHLLFLLQIGEAQALSLREMMVVKLEVDVGARAPQNHQQEKGRDAAQYPPDHTAFYSRLKPRAASRLRRQTPPRQSWRRPAPA